jgi:ribonucleotide monophosphatase NagD (HAD superfamily)
MVGDSLHHDIKGANASGIASAFITTGGIHTAEPELELTEFGETVEDVINALWQSQWRKLTRFP